MPINNFTPGTLPRSSEFVKKSRNKEKEVSDRCERHIIKNEKRKFLLD